MLTSLSFPGRLLTSTSVPLGRSSFPKGGLSLAGNVLSECLGIVVTALRPASALVAVPAHTNRVIAIAVAANWIVVCFFIVGPPSEVHNSGCKMLGFVGIKVNKHEKCLGPTGRPLFTTPGRG